MEKHSIEVVARALGEAGVRYLIVGGLAVMIHGYPRQTGDLDLVLDTEEGNLRAAIGALKQLGFRPRAPVPFDDFADAARRRAWARDRNMLVFAIASDEHPTLQIDLFLEPPFDFAAAHAAAATQRTASGAVLTFVGYADLVAMKRLAGRPQDLVDIAELEAAQRERQRKPRD